MMCGHEGAVSAGERSGEASAMIIKIINRHAQ
jgi:hypothetical protein